MVRAWARLGVTQHAPDNEREVLSRDDYEILMTAPDSEDPSVWRRTVSKVLASVEVTRNSIVVTDVLGVRATCKRR